MISEWLGTVDYDSGLALQSQWVRKLTDRESRSQSAGIILGLEHPSVITMGLRLKSLEEALTRPLPADFKVSFTDRGGQATIHSPGQLVVYPVVPLSHFQMGVRDFVSFLEQVIINTLENFGIPSFRSNSQAGVYTSEGKIAFIGLKVQHGVVSHGLSLNVSNDLDLFQLIQPCGQLGLSLDSFARRGIPTTTREVFQAFLREWTRRLSSLQT